LKPAGSIIIYAHIPSTHWRQKRKFHIYAVEITLKKTGISRPHSAARRGNGANRKTRHNNRVTSREYGRRAFYVSGDVRFQDGDAFDLGKLGGTFSLIFFYLLSMSALALAILQ